MITLAKDGSLARRQALDICTTNSWFMLCLSKFPDRYGNRPGGYTRVLQTVRRRGDNAEMAIIELV